MQLLSDVITQLSTQSATSTEEVSGLINRELTEILDQMMLKSEDITSAIISSLDGISWAERLEKGFDQHRFAAMSSALLALSDNLCKEGSTGETQNVLLEGSNGRIYVMHAGSNLVLTVFVRDGANLGITLAYAKQATSAIASMTI